ncbi:hypothetical protein ACFLRF_04815 [Candidatus Altiarchaeota archaeon]
MMKEFLKPTKGKALVFNIIMLVSVFGFLILDPLIYPVAIIINLPPLMVLGVGPDFLIFGIFRMIIVDGFLEHFPASLAWVGLVLVIDILYLCYWWLFSSLLSKFYSKLKRDRSRMKASPDHS